MKVVYESESYGFCDTNNHGEVGVLRVWKADANIVTIEFFTEVPVAALFADGHISAYVYNLLLDPVTSPLLLAQIHLVMGEMGVGVHDVVEAERRTECVLGLSTTHIEALSGCICWSVSCSCPSVQ